MRVRQHPAMFTQDSAWERRVRDLEEMGLTRSDARAFRRMWIYTYPRFATPDSIAVNTLSSEVTVSDRICLDR